MKLTEHSEPFQVPTIKDAAAWIGSTAVVTFDGAPSVLSVSLASENGEPIFAEIATLVHVDNDLALVASVRNWTKGAAGMSDEDTFDRLVLHYLSADPQAFPPTAADYREPEYADHEEHSVSVDGSATQGVGIRRLGSISGVALIVDTRLITCVWDPDRSSGPMLITAGR